MSVEQVGQFVAHDDVSIGLLAFDLAAPEPNVGQLMAFNNFLQTDQNPAETAKRIFDRYLECQQQLGYNGIRGSDLILPAQAFIRGIRSRTPLDDRHRDLFDSPQQFHEALTALRAIRYRCLKTD